MVSKLRVLLVDFLSICIVWSGALFLLIFFYFYFFFFGSCLLSIFLWIVGDCWNLQAGRKWTQLYSASLSVQQTFKLTVTRMHGVTFIFRVGERVGL